jgi:putative membrane protein
MTKKFLYLIFCGLFIGLTLFVPGFSTSVLAVTMGIYHDLIRIISNPFKQAKQNILFCLPLITGTVVGAVFFVIAFDYLFDTYEKAIFLLFTGLIAGILPVIYVKVKKCGFKKHYLIGATGAFAATLIPIVLTASAGQAMGGEGIVFSLPAMALIGFAGGSITMVPGMSISTILIITGVYSQLMFAVGALLQMDFAYLLPLALFAICNICGLALTSRGIKLVFEKHPGFANSTVFGFLAGTFLGILILSLLKSSANFSWLLGGTMFGAGLGVSVLFAVLGKGIDK